MDELTAQATLGVAFVAGIISFLSPCILPVMPAYLTVISGLTLDELQSEEATGGDLRRRVLTTSAAFVVGFSSIFVLLGASASVLGGILRGYKLGLLGFELGVGQLAGLVVIAMGLHLAGWLPIQLLYRVKQVNVQPKAIGLGSAFLVGAAFAFGWSPCIGPILGTILTLSGTQETIGEGVLLLSAYSTGLAIPFMLCGWSIEFLLRLMKGMRQYFSALEKTTGILLIVIGCMMLADLFVLVNGYSNTLLAGLADWVVSAESALLE